MQKNRLGKSSLVVPDICMGTMTFGSQADEAMSMRIMDASLEAGINFFDTAEMYPVPPDIKWVGKTEEFVGKWLATKPRDHIIIATKVAGPGHTWFVQPLRGGNTALDKNHIVAAVEGSLKKLKTDYIDLYQTHWPDPDYPVEETLRALDDLIRDGKVRAIGCSNENAWGLMKSLWQSDVNGLARFDTIQNNFSLNNRRFEDELANICRRENVSLIPYSPLAGGVLSGKYNDGFPEGARFTDYQNAGPRQQVMAKRFVNDATIASTKRFMEIARDIGISPITLATAWSKQHDFVASTIVGASHVDQLDEIFAAIDLTLNEETLKAIDAVSAEFPYPMG
ncbi:aldo/keto reductase [Sessilibacter sp. MAH4]